MISKPCSHACVHINKTIVVKEDWANFQKNTNFTLHLSWDILVIWVYVLSSFMNRHNTESFPLSLYYDFKDKSWSNPDGNEGKNTYVIITTILFAIIHLKHYNMAVYRHEGCNWNLILYWNSLSISYNTQVSPIVPQCALLVPWQLSGHVSFQFPSVEKNKSVERKMNCIWYFILDVYQIPHDI